ncbi:hypothetical protein ACHZ98_25925 [Streptomyces sp. MAR4 CNY-716]
MGWAVSLAAESDGQVPYEAQMFALFVGLGFLAAGLVCFFRHRAVAGFLRSLVAQTGSRAKGGFPSAGYVRGFGVVFLVIATGLCAFAVSMLSG